jgi:hypothetical protein
MFSNDISFNDVPKAVAHLIDKVEKIETLLNVGQRVQMEKFISRKKSGV